MDRQERIEIITNELYDKVDYLTKEYDVTLVEMLGILELLKGSVIHESLEDEE